MISSDTTFQNSDETRTLFAQTMALVAVTAGLFALGAYLGRELSYGWGWVD
jgi:modulator of FtsH protease